ncbi:nucleotide binding [Abeliophyllum distichum]|uniref:Nucleotide binding n=1 Tax=Abeliophyllum distichum TaxID=126358 RepID=A0ABD1QEN7_9LAMI
MPEILPLSVQLSRICVKNLPRYVSEDRLREFFSQKGEVTDAKLMRTKDGKSRQFGFVGYRTEQEAEEAINYFNESFMDTCKIFCEIARKVGDPNIPRPWSRYSSKKQESSSDAEKKVTGPKGCKVAAEKGEIKKSKKDDGNDDPQFQEFLQVMQPRSKSKLWANDALSAPSLEQGKEASNKKLQVKGSHGKLDELNGEFEGTEGKENILSENQEAVKADSIVHNEVVSDMDYFRSRVKKEWSDSDGNDDESSEDDDGDDDDSDSSDKILNENNHGPGILEPVNSEGEAEDGSSEESSDKIFHSDVPSSSTKDEKEGILETGRLFIRNLPYTATEEELEEHFSKFGDVSEVHIVVDKDTKRSKGIAYVLYALPESAARALEELDHSIFQGRLLHIMPAKEKNPSDKQEAHNFTQQSSKTFKQQRNDERKASEASGNTRGWNSLFMRPDTVVENIARKFGVSKSELLDREADDLAVRIALGETQVIAETKKALSNAGVNVASLEEFASGKTDGLKRSNHVILVKNLPYGSSESELADMFGKFGNLDKVILPPTKTLALVVFVEPAEARASFRGLAYKRYKDSPLYLEWAPGNILSQTPISMADSNNNVVVGEHDTKRVFLEQQLEDITDLDVDPDRIESRSLYVKNLNFKTSDENLKRHFTEHIKEGRILSVRVKKHLKNGKNVSMGFGFIEFDSVDTAVKVCRDLQGTVLDGHALILQLCHAKKDEPQQKKVDSDKSSTKLIVRNVAFEATEKDLRQLFSPFGQVKSLRLPMRFGNHRGFAFVEYITKQEAHNALKALSNTHLYGRHLVLERAKEGESLEELRARTAAQFTDSTKLSKKRKHMAVLDEGNVKFERIAD